MSRIKQFASGIGYIRRGFDFFNTHKKLWWYAIIPTVINLIVLIALIIILAHYFGDLASWIFGDGKAAPEAGILAKILGTTLSVLIWMAKALIFIILLVLLMITCFVFSMILAGPFNDILSERVERMVTGGTDIPFDWGLFCKSIWRSIIVELQKTAFFLAIPVILLVLNFLPLVGNIAYLAFASIFASFDIGFNFLDYPMSRRLWTFGRRMKVGWANKYTLAGFGIVALIPLFPYIFSAPMVTGGTLLFRDLELNETGK